MIRRLLNSIIMLSSILLSILTILISTLNYSSAFDLLLVMGIVGVYLTVNIIAYVKNWSPIRLFVYLLMITNILIWQILTVGEHYKEIMYLVSLELVFACISLYATRKNSKQVAREIATEVIIFGLLLSLSGIMSLVIFFIHNNLFQHVTKFSVGYWLEMGYIVFAIFVLFICSSSIVRYIVNKFTLPEEIDAIQLYEELETLVKKHDLKTSEEKCIIITPDEAALLELLQDESIVIIRRYIDLARYVEKEMKIPITLTPKISMLKKRVEFEKQISKRTKYSITENIKVVSKMSKVWKFIATIIAIFTCIEIYFLLLDFNSLLNIVATDLKTAIIDITLKYNITSDDIIFISLEIIFVIIVFSVLFYLKKEFDNERSKLNTNENEGL